jgi:hypothetical protein
MRTRIRLVPRLTAIAGVALLGACDSTTAGDAGTVRLHVVSENSATMQSAAAAADFGDLASATVTISHVELMPGHVVIDLGAPTVTLDLLDLQDDVTRHLGSAPALGSYEQLRLIVSDVSVTLADGTILPARVPSGPQTGIKVNFGGPIVVGPGATVDLAAVFDVDESFVFQGPPGSPRSVHFKPVIHATTVEAASITGSVTVTLAEAPAADSTVPVRVEAVLSGQVMSSAPVSVVVAAGTTTNATPVPYTLRYLQPQLAYTARASATGYTATPATQDVTVASGANTGPTFALAPTPP